MEKSGQEKLFTSDGTHIEGLGFGYEPMGDMDDPEGFSARALEVEDPVGRYYREHPEVADPYAATEAE